VNGCANLGYCGTGCPINAKQSMLVTTIPAALNHGATLMSRTRVEKILTENDKATGVEVKFIDHNGQIRNGITGTIKAKHVVMSAGAIGTPAVLLRSQIADPNSLIGKRTMIHPVNLTLGLFGEKVEGFSGAPQSIYSDEFQWRDQSIGYKLEVPPMHPVLSSIMVNGFGEEHAKVMEQLPHINAVLALVRDGFHEESQGGSIELDKHGYPVLDYPLTPILWKTFKESFANMMELQFAAGAKQVMPMHRDAGFINSWSEAKKALETLPMKPLRAKLFTAHLMGGCAMGEDKSQSVVNSYHQHHHVEGLSVMDASVFPTSLGVNPQLSIYGLTARAATHLVESLKG
ncbi:MAG: GMC family oxidoreductase, partial [Gammaproteobacteria bacterium]|nr:GMC family oxidoreductase [Gammaproteobacteria bacterium]